MIPGERKHRHRGLFSDGAFIFDKCPPGMKYGWLSISPDGRQVRGTSADAKNAFHHAYTAKTMIGKLGRIEIVPLEAVE